MKKENYNIASIECTEPSYPKYPYNEGKIKQTIEQSLKNLGLTKEKGYFKDLIRTGSNVVLKPNFVFHENHSGGKIDSLITHSSIIKAVIDLLIETNPNINITIIDVPLQSANWDELLKKSEIKKLIEKYKTEKNIEIKIIDGRKERTETDEYYVIQKRHVHNGDPLGYAAVGINDKSEHKAIDKEYSKYRVTDYNPVEMKKHHNTKKHEYLISKTVLNADLFINLPKLKTHRKGGISVSLKNLIGINGSKDWLPHHREGAISEGGDEYPKKTIKSAIFGKTITFLRLKTPTMYKYVAKAYYLLNRKKGKIITNQSGDDSKEGSWYGNDTLWRTILDINKIIIYADKNGKLKNTRQRAYLTIVDGIIGMEGEGPMAGAPKKSGVIIASFSATSSDLVAARFMGFDEKKIPSLNNLKQISKYIGPENIDQVKIISTEKKWQLLKTSPEKVSKKFIPTSGWKGHIERNIQ